MPKRLSKNAIPYCDTGFIIAFLSTVSEDAQSERTTSEGGYPESAYSQKCRKILPFFLNQLLDNVEGVVYTLSMKWFKVV